MAFLKAWDDYAAEAQKAGASPEKLQALQRAWTLESKKPGVQVAPSQTAPPAPKDVPPPAAPPGMLQRARNALEYVRPVDEALGRAGVGWLRHQTAETARAIEEPFERAGADITRALKPAELPIRHTVARGLVAAGVPKAAAKTAGRYAGYATGLPGGAVAFTPQATAVQAVLPGEVAVPALTKLLPKAARYLPSAAIKGGIIGPLDYAARAETGEAPPVTPERLGRAALEGAKGFAEFETLGKVAGGVYRGARAGLRRGIDWFEGTANRPETEGATSRAGPTPPVESEDDDGPSGGVAGAGETPATHGTKEASDPGLVARNERTDRPGSGAGGTDPDEDGGGGGGAAGPRPASRSVPPGVAPGNLTESQAAPTERTGPGTSTQRPERAGEPEPETTRPPRPLKGPVRVALEQRAAAQRQREAEALNRAHTFEVGRAEPEPARNLEEFLRRLRGIEDVEEEPGSRYEDLPRNTIEAAQRALEQSRQAGPAGPTGPRMQPESAQALFRQLLGERRGADVSAPVTGDDFERLLRQLRGEGEGGGGGILELPPLPEPEPGPAPPAAPEPEPEPEPLVRGPETRLERILARDRAAKDAAAAEADRLRRVAAEPAAGEPAAAAAAPAEPTRAPGPTEPAAAAAAAPTTRASVPFMVTKAMEQGLRDLGYRQEEIDRMKPAEAHRVLDAGERAPAAAAAPAPAPKPAADWLTVGARVRGTKANGEVVEGTVAGLQPAPGGRSFVTLRDARGRTVLFRDEFVEPLSEEPGAGAAPGAGAGAKPQAERAITDAIQGAIDDAQRRMDAELARTGGKKSKQWYALKQQQQRAEAALADILRGKGGGERPSDAATAGRAGRGGRKSVRETAGKVLPTSSSVSGASGFPAGGATTPPRVALRLRSGEIITSEHPDVTMHHQLLQPEYNGGRDIDPDEVADSGFILDGEYKQGNPVFEDGKIVDVTPTSGVPDWVRDAKDFKPKFERGTRAAADEDDTVPPPTDPEGRGPGHAPVVGTEGEVYVKGFPPVRFRYEVVEARNVIASHDGDLEPDPRSKPEVQGRNRDRAAMQDQVRQIRTKMNPGLLFDAPSTSEGAPLVGMDWQAEGGHGRVIAMKGMDVGNPSYGLYINALKGRAAAFGIDPTVLDEFDQPLLIRRRLTFVPEGERARFAEATNAPVGARLSPGELAQADARRLTPAMLDQLTLSERGTLNTEANRGFIRAFLAELPDTELNALTTAQGYLSDAGLRRVQNAVLARAYMMGGELHPALDHMFESGDEGVKTIQNALLRAAPNFAVYRGAVDAGELKLVDVMTSLLDGATTVASLRARGLKIGDWINQADLLGTDKTLLRVMEVYRDHPNVTDLADTLNDIADSLNNMTRQGAGLFGEPPPSPTTWQIIELARDPARAKEIMEEGARQTRTIEQLDQEIRQARAVRDYEKVERLEAERDALEKETGGKKKKPPPC